MAGGSRRAHTKSRNGCGQCKRRKIKCNEQAPRCSNCTKWLVKCDFEMLGNPSTISTVKAARQRQLSTSPSQSSRTSLSPSPSISLTPASPDLNLVHMELMHHFLTVTLSTLSRPGPAGKRWETAISNEAVRHGFLMHVVLGISALHMAYLRGTSHSRDEDLTRARLHQHEAVTHFRSSIVDITPENCTAAFLFSSLLLTFSSGINQAVISPDQDDIDVIVTVMLSFRSHWKLFISAQKWIEAGPLGEFLPSYDEGKDGKPELHDDTSTTEVFQELYSFNTNNINNEAERKTYGDAILDMQQSLHSGAALPRQLWPIFISDDFMDLLSQKRPMALIILAHGCALAKHGPDRWFIKDWIAKIIQAIATTLDSSWLVRMAWPLNEIGTVDIKGQEFLERNRRPVT